MERAQRILTALLIAQAAPHCGSVLYAQRPTSEVHLDFGEAWVRESFVEAARGDLRFAGRSAPLREGLALIRQPDDAPLHSLYRSATELPFDKKLTVEAWVAVDRDTDRSGFIACTGTDGEETRGFYLGTEKDRFAFGLRSGGSGTMTVLVADRPLRSGVWTHVAATYDGKRMKLFVDGVQAGATLAQSGAIAWFDRQRFTLGAVQDARGAHRMVGGIAEVHLYDRALSIQGIRKLARRRPHPLPDRIDRKIAGRGLQEFGDREYDLDSFQGRVDFAIDRGAAYLLATQEENGSWGQYGSSYPNGPTALAALALIHSGVPEDHPQIELALEYLSRRLPPSTYGCGAQLMLLGSLRNPEHKEWAEKITGKLLSFERNGEWAYPHGSPDLSNTQFAVLGFFGASLLDIHVSSDVWKRAVSRTLGAYSSTPLTVTLPAGEGRTSTKRRVHGFGYSPNSGNARFSMTTAGLCVLALAEQVGGLPARRGSKLKGGIGSAVHWLGAQFSPTESLYAMYGVERVAAFLNLNQLGEHDWYREGAEHLLRVQRARGDWNSFSDTSFALLFLSRATSKQLEGPVTGATANRVWTQEAGTVRVRASSLADGQVALYLFGFDQKTLERAPRIRAVHWAIDGKIIDSQRSESEKPWKGESFAIRRPIDLEAKHRVTCEVEFVDGDGESGRLRSKTLEFGGPQASK